MKDFIGHSLVIATLSTLLIITTSGFGSRFKSCESRAVFIKDSLVAKEHGVSLEAWKEMLTHVAPSLGIENDLPELYSWSNWLWNNNLPSEELLRQFVDQCRNPVRI